MSFFAAFLIREKLEELLKKKGLRLHLVGILGAGMLPLSKLASSFGYKITGSDARAHTSRELVDRITKDYGFRITPHRRGLLCGVDLVVTSFAIPEDSPELVDAKILGVPITTRAELLGVLMKRYKKRIGICGSHGKSTTTALVDKMLCAGGFSPTTVSGATLFDGSDLRIGEEDIFIYEACEYRDAFLSFHPTHQIITGIELDHTDYFPDLASIRHSFLRAANRAQKLVVMNSDFESSSSFSRELEAPFVTYGKATNAIYRYVIKEMNSNSCRFYIYKHGALLLETETKLFGEYNIANITAAAALSDTLGIPKDSIALAIRDFGGIERRMSRIGSLFGKSIFYDYAHHPTEISATVSAVKERFGTCAVVFIPHTYSRTKSLWNDFIYALRQADFTILMDIYPARENPVEGITSENLALSIGECAVCARAEEVLDIISGRPECAVVLMGAGDMSKVIDIIKKADGFEE